MHVRKIPRLRGVKSPSTPSFVVPETIDGRFSISGNISAIPEEQILHK